MTFEPQPIARARGQVLYRYRHGQTFDHSGGPFIARIVGYANDDAFDEPRIDHADLIAEAMRFVHRWRTAGRDTPGTDSGSDPASEFPPEEPLAETQYEVIVPVRVFCRVWPRMMRCANTRCGRVWEADEPRVGDPWPARCPSCGSTHGNDQLQYVFVHQCGEIRPLLPPTRCERCNRPAFRLNASASRFMDFHWNCLDCGQQHDLRSFCTNPGCRWTNKMMAPLVHTASSAFAGHGFSQVNVVTQDHARLRSTRPYVIAALGRWLELCTQEDFDRLVRGARIDVPAEVTTAIEAMERAGLIDQARALRTRFVPMDIEDLRARIGDRLGFDPLADDGRGARLVANLDTFERVRGLPRITVDELSLRGPEQRQPVYAEYRNVLRRAGFDAAEMTLVQSFPVTYVAVGYSRGGFEPRDADLVAYRGRSARGQAVRTLLYANPIETEALVFALDRERVARWLVANRAARPDELVGPGGVVRWFAHQLGDFDGRLPPPWPAETQEDPAHPIYGAQLLFRLLHSVAHQLLRAVAVDSGFQETGLAEYLFPYALAFAIYPNSGSEFTIGGLRTVYEQNLHQIVERALENAACIYDPNCMRSNRGVDHGCLQLPETACQSWNWHLSRWELFGQTGEARHRIVGYWEPALQT